jgi:plasmid maintenance system killer protein
MIKTFKCKHTEKLFQGNFIAKLPKEIQRSALRKLKILDAATQFETLRVPPGNRLYPKDFKMRRGVSADESRSIQIVCEQRSKLTTKSHLERRWV